MTTTLDAQAGGDNLGTVSAEMLSLTRSFVFKDNTGAVAATGSVGMFTWGTQINMVDRSGKAIGAIKEEVFSSVFKTYTTYQVLDASGQAIATSEKLEFLSTDILLKSSSGVVMAELHRSWFRLFGDRWTVDIRDPRVDPRLTLMIAAFKTGADNDGAESGGSNSTTKPGSKK